MGSPNISLSVAVCTAGVRQNLPRSTPAVFQERFWVKNRLQAELGVEGTSLVSQQLWPCKIPSVPTSSSTRTTPREKKGTDGLGEFPTKPCAGGYCG